MRRWLGIFLIAALSVELLWLVGANVFLSREATRQWLSAKRPDRVQIAWDEAWSWYPGRFSVSGAKVSGQTAKFQWQADARSARGNVALLPLLQKKVVIRWAKISDGTFRHRQRLKPDGSNQEVSRWFAPIRGYELTAQGEKRTPRRKPWQVIVHGAEVSGSYSTWVHRFQAQLQATAEVDVDVRSQGGPLHVHAENIQIDLKRAWADRNETIFGGGAISGAFALGPYRYRENRGLRSLQYLDTDLAVNLQSDDFSFVRLFLLRYPSLKVDGNGNASGELVIRQGRVAAGTNVDVEASDMAVTQPPFRISGEGKVSLAGRADEDRPFLIAMQLSDLGIFHSEDGARLISGSNLQIRLEDEGELVPGKHLGTGEPHDFLADVDIPDAHIDDAKTFNRFLPESSPMEFTGGKTEMNARLTFTPDHAGGDVSLAGRELTARFEQQDVGLDLNFDGVLEGGKPLDRKFEVAGSVIELTRARVIGEETTLDADDWSARADITRGAIDLANTLDMAFAADLVVSDSRPLSSLFINNGGPRWIARRLNVDELTGDLRLRVRDRDVYVPRAQLGAEELEFAIKAVIANPDQHGMIYLRYKKLDALLNFDAGERDIVLIGPLKKFDAYSVSLPPAP